MINNCIYLESIIDINLENQIINWSLKDRDISDLVNLLYDLKISCIDEDYSIQSYNKDSSNMSGKVEAVTFPKNELECAIIFFACKLIKIPITISAGRTNLNGSATAINGIILSIEKMKTPNLSLNIKNETVTSPVGVYLEDMRKEVLQKSNNFLYYPVDPTSRQEAMVGGTLSCNASGFVPGPQGATRFWTYGIHVITLSGHRITCKRGEYISKDGEFLLKNSDTVDILKIPTYPRPKIKNASGPFSDQNGEIDFVDFIVGSEGIFGLITSVDFKLKKMPNMFLDLFFTLPNEEQAINFYYYINNHFEGDLSKITALEYFGYNCKKYMNHWNKLFKLENEVGIYLQFPIYNDTFDHVAGEWLSLISKSKCGIDENSILILNEPRHWETFFQARHSIPTNALAKTRKLDTWSILTDTIVPPENFKKFIHKTHLIIKNSEIEYLLFGHLGDCHLHFHLIPTQTQQQEALKIYDKIIDKCTELGGVYSGEHGTGKRKSVDFIKCYGINAVNEIKVAKSVLDPDFLLNRGNIIEYTS